MPRNRTVKGKISPFNGAEGILRWGLGFGLFLILLSLVLCTTAGV